MTSNFITLNVLRVIVHDVPQRFKNNAGQGVSYSQAPIELDNELRTYIQRKILGSLRSAGNKVVADIEADQTVPDLILDRLTNKTTDFVQMSRMMADHLHQSQTGSNPGGLLCVAEVILEGGPGLAIMKLAREQAVRIERQSDIQGRFIFDLEHVRDIILSDRSRVFKAALFTLDTDSYGLFSGVVSDNQRSYTSTTMVADFYLRRFLGCKFAESPERVTKNVLDATETYIAKQVEDPETKARYITALYVEMASENPTFSPSAFAESHFRLEDRAPYRNWLAESESSNVRFTKDTELVNQRVKKVMLAFANGAALYFPPGLLGGEVQVSDAGNGLTRAVIEGELNKLQNREQ